ncbi:DUF3570 domain-containing protein [Methylococcus sp. Mc7]|uniref:DUF3570 domain-containing protein n=1 Tax=Methylococcus sp. Mc7 TaxID=2860258 RepID=UPI002105BF21|nr:DUF3570 domain-containing protein [Methylococcus sp. Mc7]
MSRDRSPRIRQRSLPRVRRHGWGREQRLRQNAASWNCRRLPTGHSAASTTNAWPSPAPWALDDLTLGIGGGNSTEWDYISNFFNLDARWNLNRKATPLAAGSGYASDTAWVDEAPGPHPCRKRPTDRNGCGVWGFRPFGWMDGEGRVGRHEAGPG